MSRKCKTAPRKATRVVNASAVGYGKWKVAPGDWIRYREDADTTRFARVIGEITACDSDGENCVGALRVLAVSDSGTFGYERWVKPDAVVEALDVGHARTFLGWLLNADVKGLSAYLADDLPTREAATFRP